MCVCVCVCVCVFVFITCMCVHARTGNETCEPHRHHAGGDGCVDGPDPVCPDKLICGIGRCDRSEDACVIDCDDSECDDYLFCTVDTCLQDKTCENRPNSTACNDDCACTDDRYVQVACFTRAFFVAQNGQLSFL